MAKIYKKTRGDARRLNREAKKGDVYYGTENTSRRFTSYEDAQLANRWEVTGDHQLLGGPMCGSMSLEAVLDRYGPLSTEPPAGLRGTYEPSPQVAGPFDDQPNRRLDRSEIRALEKLAKEARDEQAEVAKRSWF